MTAQVSSYQTVWWTPLAVKGTLGSSHEIRSLTVDDPLCQDVIEYLKKENRGRVFGEERRYSHSEATATVHDWRTRVELGNPFSGLAILNGKEVVGVIQIELDGEGKLRLSGMGLQKDQNKVVVDALDWLLRVALPRLHEMGCRIRLRNEWLDLDKTSVVITGSSKNKTFLRLIDEMNFSSQKQVAPGPLSLWRRPRSVYEVAGLLYTICIACLKEIRAGNFLPCRGRTLEVHEVPLSRFIVR